MIRNFSKTIFIIVFVVFLGIKNVNAVTCIYSKAENRLNSVYTIKLDGSGIATSITYKQTDIQTGAIMKEEDYTISKSVDFTKCPESISVSDDKITTNGDYKKVPNTPEAENEGLGSNIGNMKTEDSLVSCGTVTDIPSAIPSTVRIIYLVIQVLVPLLLIVFGMIDLAKGVMAQKEDEIKKGQKTFFKRLISAAVVFLVFVIVKMVASFFSDNSSVVDCLNCFIRGQCSTNPTENAEEDGEPVTFKELDSVEVIS